ncbi:unnamed protein product [Linum tenue]|uniref:DUF4283 domain-containing protein n=1 Tax=Linum tenue TaxID=586396 RepID=A0AAV0NUX1_9ROSI|nr:unnamed protein product [Linum tenue]
MEEVIVEDCTEEELNAVKASSSAAQSTIPIVIDEPKTQAEPAKTSDEGTKETPIPVTQSVWGNEKKKTFSEIVQDTAWYVEDSDGEDVMEAIREDDEDYSVPMNDDPKCPTIPFTVAEVRKYRREWRSALMVKVLGRTYPYPVVAKRLQALWARTGPIQITNRTHVLAVGKLRLKIGCITMGYAPINN